MKKDLPRGGVNPATQGALVKALKDLTVEELVTVVIYGNEFQKGAAMNRLEEIESNLEEKHLPLLFRVHRRPVKEHNCAGRCHTLWSNVRSRSFAELAAADAVA